MKNTISIILIIVAILTGVAGVLNYTMQAQLLNSNLYKNALEESGIYDVTTTVVSENISQGLVSLQKGIVSQVGIISPEDTETSIIDKIVLTLLNTVIDTQTPRLVDTILTNVNFQQNIQNYSDQVIDQSLGWLRGDIAAGEYFDKIPAPEEVIAFKQASLSQLLYQLTSNTLGTKELPFCTSPEDIQSNLDKALSGNFNNLTCTNNQIQPLVDAFFATNLAQTKINQAETNIQTQLDAFGITKIIDGIYEIVLTITQIKQDLLGLQSFLRLNLQISYTLLLVSVISLLIGLVLKTANRLKTLIKAIFTIGATVLGISLVYWLIISEGIIYQLDVTRITTFQNLLTPSQNTALLQSLNQVFIYLIKHMIDYTFMAGLGLTVFSGTLWIMFDLITSNSVQDFFLKLWQSIKNGFNNAINWIKSKTSKTQTKSQKKK